jgi:hypothetical protein
LVDLLASSSTAVLEPAAEALVRLAADASQQQAIAAAGVIPSLVHLLGRSGFGSSIYQQVAARVLGRMAADSRQNQQAVVAAGAVPKLTLFLNSTIPEVRQAVAAALTQVSGQAPSPVPGMCKVLQIVLD